MVNAGAIMNDYMTENAEDMAMIMEYDLGWDRLRREHKGQTAARRKKDFYKSKKKASIRNIYFPYEKEVVVHRYSKQSPVGDLFYSRPKGNSYWLLCHKDKKKVEAALSAEKDFASGVPVIDTEPVTAESDDWLGDWIGELSLKLLKVRRQKTKDKKELEKISKEMERLVSLYA